MPILGLLTKDGSFHTCIPKLDTNWSTFSDSNMIQKIPSPTTYQKFSIYTIIPFQDMDALYFLYTDKERNVVKYNLTTKSHSIIKKSQSVNLMHYATISKTRIGKFYWIFGDIEDEFRCGEICTYLHCFKIFSW